jgi:HlyD family secretion protein
MFPHEISMTETPGKPPPQERSRATRLSLALAVAALSLAGCSGSGPRTWQGYLEGDFIYVASPLAGRLETLAVEKGSRVKKGAPLFGLEHAAESDALRQASQELKASQSQLDDLMKGSRPDEIAALEARLAQSRATEELSRLDLARQAELFKAGAISASDFDRARLTHEANAKAVDEDAARLETARLGGRADAVAAARALVRAAADAEAHARWSVEQKAQAAPRDALVYDTLYREGEFVTAASPVVALLPPGNLKARFFVSEQDFGLIKAGDRVTVAIDGLPGPLEARVSYLSPQPEYTPPVLYNRDNRSKLVYMIEAVFAGNAAADLHPGEPVDVSLAAR